MGGPWSNKKNSENEEFEVSQCRKKGESHSVETSGKGDPSALEWLVRGFGCVENEVLSTYSKSA